MGTVQFNDEWNEQNYLGTLAAINNGAPIEVKDATVYESSKWVPHTELTVPYPIQRKILKHECVLDFDNVTDLQVTMIVQYFQQSEMKFNAWRSSNTGLHIHFFANVYGKYQKIMLAKIVASRIEELYGVKNDIQPMHHGFVRCEYSVHPQKNIQKVPVWCGINPLFPINTFPTEILQKINKNAPKLDENGRPIVENAPKSLENPPKCVRYILSNRFIDGRKRLLFVLTSWYKNLLPDEEIFQILKDWARRQELSISDYKIRTTIKSTNGTAGCTYRHMVLEELGHDPQCGKK